MNNYSVNFGCLQNIIGWHPAVKIQSRNEACNIQILIGVLISGYSRGISLVDNNQHKSTSRCILQLDSLSHTIRLMDPDIREKLYIHNAQQL